MSDLVERLRAQAAEIKRLKEKTQYWPDNAERDAVIKYQKEEIERLLNALADERTENMRLRAALEGK